MFCSNCGARAEGNFCSACGNRLTSSALSAGIPNPPHEEPPLLAEVCQDWRDETRYDALLQFPEVQELLGRHASQARKGLSGEEVLELYDKVMKPITGVSLATVMSIALPIYTRLGIKTGKARQERLRERVGVVLVTTLCSLARHGWTLKQVHQAEDGCVIEAVLPSDIWSSEGELIVTVRRVRTQTQIDAATKIPGQLYDWGKSKQCLNELFDDLLKIAA